MTTYTCDVAIIGGSMGGVAAALAACDAGMRVVLTEATDWLGGQMTSQGVSALDEHQYIEHFGGTHSYMRLRQMIRQHYRDRYDAPAHMPDGAPLNPGNGWVSRLCFEPRVGLEVIDRLLAPHVRSGRLTILLQVTPHAADVAADRVRAVTLRDPHGAALQITADYVLDATDLGDLLPLVGVEYVSGAEAQADTGEPQASPDGARPDEVQGFTYCFAVERRPGENHTIPAPAGYRQFRERQPYALEFVRPDQSSFRYFMDRRSSDGYLPFWTYRRVFAGDLLGGRDIAMINWPGNDYHAANLIDRSPDEQHSLLDEAKRLALGFLHWLQTEAPRDDGGHGYPEFRLLPEVMGTDDGLSKAPYIRESRRIVALKRIVEQEIAAEYQPGARAARFADSVGVGSYAIDIHTCVGSSRTMYAPTRPFQIPLGALLPRRVVNLIAACKNIGTTHLTNGAYRLHPVEWNIGEAAGALAAMCVRSGVAPRVIHDSPARRLNFQRMLLERGMPLAWAIDVPLDDPLFVPTQLLLLHGAVGPDSPRFGELAIAPDQAIDATTIAAAHDLMKTIGGEHVSLDETTTWRAMCERLHVALCDGKAQ